MMEAKETSWQARWIWGGEEESPRNEWRQFRRSFDCPADLPAGAEAKLWVTADSRYEIYVNGTRIGRGPARYFPTQIFYDCYPVGHLLRRGQKNTIAVLVMHFGVTNFYYLRGRGGLLAELAVTDGAGELTLAATGSDWRTSLQAGHARETARMSCQHAFAERIDARLMDEDWMDVPYDDRAWKTSTVIGEVGMEPWTNPQPRDIPYLTEEAVGPVGVLSLNRVVPYRLTAFLDNYALMKPHGEENANPLCYAGAFATVLRLKETSELNIVLHVSGFGIGDEVPGVLRIGDRTIEPKHEPPLLRCRVTLPAGEHLLLYAAYGADHGGMQRIGIDSDKPIEWANPIASDAGRTAGTAEAGSPFAAIGPLYAFTVVDFEVQTEQFAAWKQAAARLAAEVSKIGSASELHAIGSRLIPIPALLCNAEDAFMPQFAKRLSEQYAIPASLQQVAVASCDPGAVPVFADGDTEFTLDFGKEWSGYLQFELEAEAGVTIDWYGVEYRKGDYVQHTYGLDNTLRYVTKEGYQRYTSPVRRGFRYQIVTVRGATRPVCIHGVRVLQSNYPSPEIGAFQCSDASLNAIWEMARHTTRLCMEDTFVDCPAYEQTFWVGDSRNEALVNYYLFGGTDIVKRCLRLVPGSAFQTPLYVDQVPSGWRSVIPNWTFFWAAACAEYAEHTGDREFAAEMLPKVMYTLLHYAQRLNGDGLLEMKGWNLLDWAPMDQPGDGVVTHQNMIFTHALRRTAALAELAGGEAPAEAKWCEELAAKLGEAINLRLWSEERGAYLDCIHKDGRRSEIFSMQTQVMALLSGLAQGERKATLTSYLSATPEGFVPIGSPFMSFFYYEALMQGGDVARMLDDIRQNYGFMIDNGATTCWEMYGHTTMNRANANDLTRSHCHAWSAAPGYFLGAYVLGVRAAAPGWAKVVIEPLPGDLQWAKGAVPLPDGGKVEVAWKVEAGQLATLDITAPEGIELELRVPSSCAVSIHRLKTL
ncbi:alpha-L-rhamnosidase C-terminal domain-containing protein [Paenibacillus sp. LHD-117]|uniref:family 78 glycoside hydrolase catalytic domain n=1 Tax=Paenibacillus sp. LHD-117 TaxID=3071412 RepID=UPI0027E16811|nr:family 78 glycoside hydrolase catalytic domain [Paenibacillus sp. LHD-117]MDQ6422752.1 alpha-L-rhamnosidase C-terminal domain-containing protein [Paenibacillus sp. LHD-117]